MLFDWWSLMPYNAAESARRREAFARNWRKVRPRFTGNDAELAAAAGISASAIVGLSKRGTSIDRGNTVHRVCAILGVVPESMWEASPRFTEASETITTPPTSDARESIREHAHEILDDILDTSDPFTIAQLLDALRRAAQR